MPPIRFKAVLFPAFLLFLLLIAAFFLLNSLLQKPSVQRRLVGYLSDSLEYDLAVETIQVSLIGGIGINADHLVARSRTGPGTITASKVRLAFDVIGLLKGQMVPSRIYLSHPTVDVDIKEKASPGLDRSVPPLTKALFKKFAQLDSVVLEKAQLRVKDFPYRLEELHARVVREKKHLKRLRVHAHGKVGFHKGKIAFRSQGAIAQDPDKDDPFAEIMVETEEIPLSWVSWPDSVPALDGTAGARITFRRFTDGALSAEGEISTNGLGFSLSTKNRKKEFRFPRLTLDVKAIYAKNIFNLLSLKAETPDFSLHGSALYNFKDKANPHMTIKAESPFMSLEVFKTHFPSPILPQWIEAELFPVLRGGDVSLDLFSLAGTAKQITDLDLPENNDCLFLRMSWKDLLVLEGQKNLPFREVSGRLAIENGALEIADVRSSFGDSAIKNGSLYVEDIYDSLATYCVEVEGSFTLKDLKSQSEMSYVPWGVQEKIEDFEDVSGKLDAHIQVFYDPFKDLSHITWGEFRFKDCAVAHTKLFLPLLLTEGSYSIDQDGMKRFRGKGLWGKSQIQVTGSGGRSWERCQADVTALVDMNEVADSFFGEDLRQARFSKLLKSKFILARKEGLWSLSGEVDLDGLGLDMPTLSLLPQGKGNRVAAEIDYIPKGEILFKELRCSLGNSRLKASGSYNVLKKEFNNLETEASLRLEDLGIKFKESDTQATGSITCAIQSDVSLRTPSETTIRGEFSGADLRFVSSRLPAPVNNCNFRATFSDHEVFIPSLKMLVGRSPVHIMGQLKGWDGLLGKLSVTSTRLNLTDFVADTPGDPSTKKDMLQSRFLTKSDVTVNLEVIKGQWKGLKYGPLHAECAFRSGNLYVKRSHLKTSHGAVSLKGHIKRGQNPEHLFSSHISLAKQPAKELLDSLGVKKAFLDGLLTMEANLSGKGKHLRGLVAALKGNADVLLEKGKIMKSHVVFEVLHFLDLQKIFKKRPPDISREGFYYEAIKMTLDINRGIVSTSDFIMKSPVFNAAGKGTLDMPRNWIDFDLGAQPLGTMDTLVSKIPVIGYILTGKKKTLLMYYFKIKGPFYEPEVQYVPLKNLGKSMIGFFKRLLLTPVRLLQ